MEEKDQYKLPREFESIDKYKSYTKDVAKDLLETKYKDGGRGTPEKQEQIDNMKRTEQELRNKGFIQ